MTRKRKTFTWIVVVVSVLGAARIIYSRLRRSPIDAVSLTGAVLRRDSDPRKQSPIANAKVMATSGLSTGEAKSDSSGLFHVTLRPGVRSGEPITLRFEHSEYRPLEITETPKDQLYIVRLEPLVQEASSNAEHPETPATTVRIKNVRVRYSVKNQTTINVGSIAKQFEVINTGNVPCKGRRPCSPDGKWRAAIGSLSFDAQEGNEFRNVRVSCVAGPCPFTRIERDDLSRPARTMKISVLNWSDTAGFLVEAEVTRTMVTDMIRHSYPFITGQMISFALPAAAEGPSLEADLNGEEIVFPLGPKLVLSWATCSVEIAPGHNKIYRCELKRGYQFEQ